MNKIIFAIFAIVLLITTGCVPVLIGAGVVTGYMVSNDSAVGNVKGDYRDLWDISMEVLRETDEVEIIEVNESKGRIKAKIGEIGLMIKIDTLDRENQKLKVCARKYFLPRPQYAQKIFFKIIKELE